jgi:hypothetical protein
MRRDVAHSPSKNVVIPDARSSRDSSSSIPLDDVMG